MENIKATLIALSAAILGVALGCVLMALPVWILWNILLTKYFGIMEVTFLDSLGFCVLVRCLLPNNGSKES